MVISSTLYQHLIVALGLDLKWDKIEGLNDAIGNRATGVCSNYSAFTVERTHELNKSLHVVKSMCVLYSNEPQ